MKYAKWRQRLRGMCKWGGVTLCVLLFALWLASGWLQLSFTWLSGDSTHDYTFGSVDGVLIRAGEFMCLDEFPWTATQHSAELNFEYDPPLEWLWTYFIYDHGPYALVFPLWLPFLLIALPTGYLFWSDHRRRMRAGCCPECGYDLTGNTTGRCPECGAAASSSERGTKHKGG